MSRLSRFAAPLPALLLLAGLPLRAADQPAEPVTPGALPEVRALLQVLHGLSGRHTLTGQHNFPAIRSANSDFAARHTGRVPAVFSTDWGFAAEGDTDSYLARPDIVAESIRQHRLGALVTICWHAVPPTADEPVTFQPRPGADPKALASVQGRLRDEQFRDVLTPGTALHRKWCAQVDAIAVHLKKLEEARVPVLWRPYHEMNGDWFWWGGRPGEHGTAALYRQIFDRLVHHHQLKNLLWVWSVDRVSRPGMEHGRFFPGIGFMDVLALDVYRNDFAQSYYDSLVALAQGKPVTLAEVGNPPAPEILRQQPGWIFYVVWAGMARNATPAQYDALMREPRMLNLDDPRYAEVMAPYRQAAGLPPIRLAPPPADFTGTWVLDEDESQPGPMGFALVPARLEVARTGGALVVRSTRILEFKPDETTEETLPLDGTPVKDKVMNSPRVTSARLAPDGSGLTVDSTLEPAWAPPGTKLAISDTWTTRRGGRRLVITRHSQSGAGAQTATLVYDRR